MTKLSTTLRAFRSAKMRAFRSAKMRAFRPTAAIGTALVLVAEPASAFIVVRVPEANTMTLCPYAMVAGCRKCPAFSFCPLKSVLGDHKPSEEPSTQPPKDETKSGES